MRCRHGLDQLVNLGKCFAALEGEACLQILSKRLSFDPFQHDIGRILFNVEFENLHHARLIEVLAATEFIERLLEDADVVSDRLRARASINQFEKAHPNVRVTIETFPYTEYQPKLTTQFSSGGGPDVYWVNTPMIARQ